MGVNLNINMGNRSIMFLLLTYKNRSINMRLFNRVKTYLPARDDAAEFDDHDRDFPTGIGNLCRCSTIFYCFFL